MPPQTAVGGIGSFLDSVTIIPATTASGAVTSYDGSTAFATIPAAAALGQSAPYCVQLGIRATSPTTGFKITTGASVTVIAVGRSQADLNLAREGSFLPWNPFSLPCNAALAV